MAKSARITIKHNTQQLLVWLYSSNGLQRLVPIEDTNYLWWQLVSEGRRSLLRHLVKNDYITVNTIRRRKYLCLTSFGRECVERLFPGLSPQQRFWQGQWQLIVLTGANEAAAKARSLRQLLRQEGAFLLERGVYMCPAPLNSEFKNRLTNDYRGQLLIWETEKCLFGDERLIIFRKSGLLEVLNLYSGISNDLSRLTDLRKSEKYSIDQYMSLLISTFTCFFDILSQDSGLIRFYFKNELCGEEILSRLQNLALFREEIAL